MRTTLFTAFSIALALPAAAKDTINECVPEHVVTPGEIQEAVSLAAVEDVLKDCGHRMNCGEDARKLFGLTRIDGFLIDADKDIVLIGRKIAKLNPLDIEDFIIMLRHALHRYARTERGVGEDGRPVIRRFITPAGVTIDPQPRAIAALNELSAHMGSEHFAQEWPRRCRTEMTAKTLGMPHGLSASAKLMQADYVLKYISNGEMQLQGVPSILERNLERMIRADPAQSGSLTRFWFTAGRHDIVEDSGLFLYRRANVALLDEAEFMTSEGKIASSGETNVVARAFSCDFSKQFAEFIDRPDLTVFKELDDVFRWGLTATLLEMTSAFARAGYRPEWLIEQAPVTKYDVPTSFEGVSRIFRWPDHAKAEDLKRAPQGLRAVLASCGGVTVDHRRSVGSLRNDSTGRLSRLKQAVLQYKPAPDAQSWPVRFSP